MPVHQQGDAQFTKIDTKRQHFILRIKNLAKSADGASTPPITTRICVALNGLAHFGLGRFCLWRGLFLGHSYGAVTVLNRSITSTFLLLRQWLLTAATSARDQHISLPSDSKYGLPKFVEVEWMVATPEYDEEWKNLSSRAGKYSKPWIADADAVNAKARHHTKRVDLTSTITPALIEQARVDRKTRN